jgi:hypothetical protein
VITAILEQAIRLLEFGLLCGSLLSGQLAAGFGQLVLLPLVSSALALLTFLLVSHWAGQVLRS